MYIRQVRAGPGGLLVLNYDNSGAARASYVLGGFYYPNDVPGAAFLNGMPHMPYIRCKAVTVVEALHRGGSALSLCRHASPLLYRGLVLPAV